MEPLYRRGGLAMVCPGDRLGAVNVIKRLAAHLPILPHYSSPLVRNKPLLTAQGPVSVLGVEVHMTPGLPPSCLSRAGNPPALPQGGRHIFPFPVICSICKKSLLSRKGEGTLAILDMDFGFAVGVIKIKQVTSS